MSSTDFERESVEMQSIISDVSIGQAHEIVFDKLNINLPIELYMIKNDETVFEENDSSLEGSILSSGRRSNNKKSDSIFYKFWLRRTCQSSTGYGI